MRDLEQGVNFANGTDNLDGARAIHLGYASIATSRLRVRIGRLFCLVLSIPAISWGT